MITVVVIGRNDNHGYNLAKRVASSLNSVAEMLGQDDEIIFVDWNTPMGYPVMPVSIQDDLLPKTKSLLRIIRVPESVHDQVSEGSSRALIEPLARNVGIRAADKKSKWILSTNTDILFVSPSKKKFSEIVSGLEETLWLSFRFEIPEFIWDEFDRRSPIETSRKLLDWYAEGRFIKRVQVSHASGATFVIPDGVGDFQLAPRLLWEKVTGFPEDMKKGWHVDTRLTLQMDRTSETSPQLVPEENLLVFHQNHLRNSTSYHSSHESNSLESATKPFENPISWGLRNFPIEEIRIFQNSKETTKLIEGNPQLISPKKSDVENLISIKNNLNYDLTHALNFLADEISILPKHSVVHCFSGNSDTREAISSLCVAFEVEIKFYNIKSTNFRVVTLEPLKNHLLILDCGVASVSPVPSPFVGGELSHKIIDAGLIVYSLDHIAASFANSKTRVALLRSQNWATREFARSVFLLPLFNNYTNVLSGTIEANSRLNFLQKRIYLGGVVADYGLSVQDLRLLSNVEPKRASIRINTTLYRLIRALPTRLRILAKKVLSRIVNI